MELGACEKSVMSVHIYSYKIYRYVVIENSIAYLVLLLLYCSLHLYCFYYKLSLV